MLVGEGFHALPQNRLTKNPPLQKQIILKGYIVGDDAHIVPKFCKKNNEPLKKRKLWIL